MSLRQTGTLIGLLFFTILLLVYFFSFGDWDVSPLRAISYQLLLLLAFIHIVSLLCYTLAVWVLLKDIRPHSSFSTAYLTLTTSLVIGYFLPGRLGLPVRVYLYHRLFELTVGAASGLVGLELAVTTLIPFIFSIPGLWIFYSNPWLSASVRLLIFLSLLLALIFYLLRRDGAKIGWIFKTRSFFSPLSPFVEGLGQMLRRLNFWTLGLFSLLCFLILLCSVWFSKVLLLHLGWPVSFLTLLSIQSLSYLAGLISLMPMGLGARELSLAVLLGEAGVPADVATYTAVIQRVLATGLSFLLGLLSMQVLWLKGSLRQLPQNQEVHSIREP